MSATPLADPPTMCMFTEVFSQTFAQRGATDRPRSHEEVFTLILCSERHRAAAAKHTPDRFPNVIFTDNNLINGCLIFDTILNPTWTF